MTSVPRLEFKAQEEWTVNIYEFEIECDEEARSNFKADPAGFLRRQIELAYRHQPRIREPINWLLIDEELLDPSGPPCQIYCEHVETPQSRHSQHGLVARLEPDPRR